MTVVKYEKIHPDAKTPEQATSGSIGYDLFATEDVEIKPGETKVIKTGLRFGLSEGQFILITSKSGLAAKQNIFVLNSPGLIDSDFRGEIGVILYNLHSWNSLINLIVATFLRYTIGTMGYLESYIDQNFPVNTYKISKGTKVAQAIFFPDQNVELVEGNVDTNTERGEGGFGSTGK